MDVSEESIFYYHHFRRVDNFYILSLLSGCSSNPPSQFLKFSQVKCFSNIYCKVALCFSLRPEIEYIYMKVCIFIYYVGMCVYVHI